MGRGGPQGTQSFGGADAVGLSGESGAKTFEVHAVGKIEIRGEHGAVKNGQAQFVEQPKLDAGQVAISKERLGVDGDGLKVEVIKQVVRSVAAANTHDGSGIRVGEGGVQIGEALLRGSGEVERLAQKSVGRELRRIAQRAEGCESAIDALRLCRRRRGDDGDGRIRRDWRWFEQGLHFTKPPRGR